MTPPKKNAAAAAPRVASKIELWPIGRLVEFKGNPRTHTDEQVREIAGAIREFGFTQPPLVDEKRNVILSGHARVRAAKMLQMKKVPVICIGYLSRAQQLAYVIADNRLAEKAGWDRLALGAMALELKEDHYPLDATGFTEAELEGFMAELAAAGGVVETDPPPALAEKATTRAGDTWVLGDHRVRCGDARSIDDMVALLDGRKVDAAWTDPPYGVGYNAKATAGAKASKGAAIRNDQVDEGALAGLLAAAFATTISSMKDGAPIYVAHPDSGGLTFRRLFEEAGFYLSSCLIWRKSSLVMSRGDYHWSHEPVLYGWKPGRRHRWYGGRKQTSVQEFAEPPFQQVDDNEWQIRVGDDTLLVRGKGLTIELARGSVFSEAKPSSSREHPTMKPVPLIERMLRNSARAGDVVLDPFGGSGSTLIACEHLGMGARCLELEPAYVDVMVRRWQNLTKKPALHAESGKAFADMERRRKNRAA